MSLGKIGNHHRSQNDNDAKTPLLKDKKSLDNTGGTTDKHNAVHDSSLRALDDLTKSKERAHQNSKLKLDKPTRKGKAAQIGKKFEKGMENLGKALEKTIRAVGNFIEKHKSSKGMTDAMNEFLIGLKARRDWHLSQPKLARVARILHALQQNLNKDQKILKSIESTSNSTDQKWIKSKKDLLFHYDRQINDLNKALLRQMSEETFKQAQNGSFTDLKSNFDYEMTQLQEGIRVVTLELSNFKIRA